MKWKEKPKLPDPQDGTYRVRTKFLSSPMRIGFEWRWLESASWVEKYWAGNLSKWWAFKWIDDLQEQKAPSQRCPDCDGIVRRSNHPTDPPAQCLDCGRAWWLKADVAKGNTNEMA